MSEKTLLILGALEEFVPLVKLAVSKTSVPSSLTETPTRPQKKKP